MSEKLLVPGWYGAERIPFEKVLQALPVLNQARYELNVVTGEREYVAPEGYAFCVTGDFYTSYDSNSMVSYGPPQESRARIEREIAENNGRPLIAYADDDIFEENPIEIDPALFPESFIGQRLTLEVRHLGYDATTSAQSDKDDVLNRCSFNIHGVLDAHFEAGLQDFVWQKSADSTTYDVAFVTIPLGILYWDQEFAHGNALNSYITLIPYTPPKRDFTVVSLSKRDAGLQVIRQGKSVDDIYQRYHEFYATTSTEAPMEEDIKKAIILDYRAQGRLLAEDPLNNFIFLDKSELTLDEAVSQTIAQSAPPLRYAEMQLRHQEMADKAIRDQKIKHLRSSIAVIAGVRPLSELVAELTRPGWEEREIDSTYTFDWLWSSKYV